MIALNSSQAAEGELYVDDGRSFEFQQGSYIHRRLVFADGKLTSLNLAPGHTQFSSECVVERIILQGLSTGQKSALVEPANQKAEIERGPLLLYSRQGPTVLTIRKPNVRIADDWVIKIF